MEEQEEEALSAGGQSNLLAQMSRQFNSGEVGNEMSDVKSPRRGRRSFVLAQKSKLGVETAAVGPVEEGESTPPIPIKRNPLTNILKKIRKEHLSDMSYDVNLEDEFQTGTESTAETVTSSNSEHNFSTSSMSGDSPALAGPSSIKVLEPTLSVISTEDLTLVNQRGKGRKRILTEKMLAVKKAKVIERKISNTDISPVVNSELSNPLMKDIVIELPRVSVAGFPRGGRRGRGSRGVRGQASKKNPKDSEASTIKEDTNLSEDKPMDAESDIVPFKGKPASRGRRPYRSGLQATRGMNPNRVLATKGLKRGVLTGPGSIRRGPGRPSHLNFIGWQPRTDASADGTDTILEAVSVATGCNAIHKWQKKRRGRRARRIVQSQEIVESSWQSPSILEENPKPAELEESISGDEAETELVFVAEESSAQSAIKGADYPEPAVEQDLDENFPSLVCPTVLPTILKLKKKKKHFKGLRYSFINKRKKQLASKRTAKCLAGDSSQETDSTMSEEVDNESVASSSMGVPSEQLYHEGEEDTTTGDESDCSGAMDLLSNRPEVLATLAATEFSCLVPGEESSSEEKAAVPKDEKIESSDAEKCTDITPPIFCDTILEEAHVIETNSHQEDQPLQTPQSGATNGSPSVVLVQEEESNSRTIHKMKTRRSGSRDFSVTRCRYDDWDISNYQSDSSDAAFHEAVRKSKRSNSSPLAQPLVIAAPDRNDNSAFVERDAVMADPKLANILCRCRVRRNPSAVGIVGEICCQAISSYDGRLIGCCNAVSCDSLRYLRVSNKIPFLLLCDIHRQQLRRHLCCPGCGLFCSQGLFSECEYENGIPHYYHKLCCLQIDDKSLCPHCGSSQSPNEVTLELKMSRKPIIYNKQQQDRSEPSARMCWPKEKKEVSPVDEEPLPVEEPVLELSNGNHISAFKMPACFDKESLQSAIRMIGAGKVINAKATAKAVYWSCKHGDMEKLLYVLLNGVSPDARSREYGNQTGLHVAAANGMLAAVHVLILAGAALDPLDAQLLTPLMGSIVKEHTAVAKYLVKAGASVHAKTQEGMTCLHLAAKSGNIQVCQSIIESGQMSRRAINAQDEGGWTPLVWASENRFCNVVRYILENGGNPQLCDIEKNTALHWASFSGSIDISELILNKGCSMWATNIHGDTPIHIAARQNHAETVSLLLSRRSPTRIRNNKGQTALDCAVPDSEAMLQLQLSKKLKRIMEQNGIRAERMVSSDISNGKERIAIPCINGFDNEKMPHDYFYIAENCEARNVTIDRTITSLKCCDCEDGCVTDMCVCGQLNFQCWYNSEGNLLPEFSYIDPPMIFECNRACQCNALMCINRVMQNGISAHLQVYRTENKGWGVRSAKDVPKGSYVCEYVGEIITDVEADQRQEDSYLFDLDNKDSDTCEPFCLDARNYGNVARFINHQCDPNLTPVKVFIDHQDLAFPRIALFANRDIPANEELGFDYGEKFWIIKYKHFTCNCAQEKCKYSKDTIQFTLHNYNNRNQSEQLENLPS